MDATDRRAGHAFARLWACAFCVFSSLYVLLPFFPVFAARRSTGPGIGVLMGAFFATCMIARSWAGWIVDRRGRRPVLVVGAACVALSCVIYPLATSFVSLLLLRIAHGVAIGSFA